MNLIYINNEKDNKAEKYHKPDKEYEDQNKDKKKNIKIKIKNI